MHRTRSGAILISAAMAASSLAVGSSPVQGSAGTTTYLVLASDAASVDAAIAAVQAAGGQVDRVNTAIGLITVTADAASFQGAVSSDADVAGVARNTPIGSVPADATNRRDAVEREGRGTGEANAAAASGRHDDDDEGDHKGDRHKAAEPLAGLQWDMQMIDATPEGSYDEQRGRREVLVGIIDTGIDGSHPDIARNFNRKLSRNFTVDIPLVDGPCEEETDQSCDDPADVDDNGHGTHVAGTVAAPINGIGMAGVAPNVTLVNLRAGQDSGYFFLGETVDALTYAGDNGIDVVNMSYFTDPWLYNCRTNPADSAAEQAEQATIIDATQRALDYARKHGVTLVAALGNQHQDLGAALKTDAISPDFPPGAERVREVTNDCLTVPTESDGVIGVSAVGPSTKKADFSNHGLEQNDVSAPGGFFRDFIDDPLLNRKPETQILGPYPKNVALADGTVDPVTGASLTPFVIAQCSSPSIDDCDYWQLIQGTSMAAPHAVGVAALIVSEFGKGQRHGRGRTMSPAKVERVLLRSATDVACPSPVISYAAEGRDASYDAPCIGTPERNSIYGDGIVNALAAVEHGRGHDD
ncbi:MAG: S8 family serine peptidase [Actinomycetota bacterium]|nr:S8 family serine peptidase [Actinomycetota bacterium]